MNKEEIFNIFYGKETWDIWKKFQEIESSIDESKALYEYFNDIEKMLFDEKSYIKMRGFKIICKLSKWDKDNRINNIIDVLLQVLDDKKPTIVRLCLSSLNNLLLYKIDLSEKIENKLKNMDLSKYKDSMKPLIQKDIDCILKQL
ncbi:MAG: hypothetical protein ACI32H_04170 [Bacilli bacterium]